MRRSVLVGAAVVAVVLVAGIAWLVWPRGASEVTLEEAQAELESRPSGSSEGDLRSGVYVYEGEGTQSVKFGGLTNEDRTIPGTVNVGIDATGDGCFQIDLNLLDQHVERTWFCATDDVLTMERHRKEMEVGALSPTIDMRCEPGLVIDPTGDATTDELVCPMDVSVAVVETTGEATGSAVVRAAETVTIAGTERVAIPVELTYSMDGGMAGTWTEHYWFDEETMLPLRIERTMDLSGPASISETSTLILTDLEPVPAGA